MRLIDADVMHGEIDKYDLEGRMSLKNIKRYIDAQPTAYDIDKIMEQLERCLIGWMPDETIYEIIKLLKEGGEEEIDWSQVEVDTPILVRDSVGEPWHRGYFAKYDNGVVFTWMFTFTSQNTPNGNISAWRFAELEEAGEQND